MALLVIGQTQHNNNWLNQSRNLNSENYNNEFLTLNKSLSTHNNSMNFSGVPFSRTATFEGSEKFLEINNKKKVFRSRRFSIVSCENITTVWVDNVRSSFLTNPLNNDTFFYLRFFDNKFKTRRIFEEVKYELFLNTINIVYLKVFFNNLQEFLEENQLEYIYSKLRKKRIFSIIFQILTLCLFISFIICTIQVCILAENTVFIQFLSLLMLFFSAIICTCGFCQSDLTYEKLLYKFFKYSCGLNNKIQHFLDLWNTQLFNKYNMSIYIPFTLSYLEISMKNKCKLILQEHEYPIKNYQISSKFAKMILTNELCNDKNCVQFHEVYKCYEMNCSIISIFCFNKKCLDSSKVHHYHKQHK